MMHAAEDAARFLHHACQGLPQRRNGHPACETDIESTSARNANDRFYVRVIEHAVAYFGSRVLYPSRARPGQKDLRSRDFEAAFDLATPAVECGSCIESAMSRERAITHDSSLLIAHKC